MILHILHETTYRYEQPVRYSVQSLRLTPRRDGGQRTLNWRLSAPGRRIEQLDAHGNIAHLLTVDEPHDEIRIVASGAVEVPEGNTPLIERGPLVPLVYVATTALTLADDIIEALASRALGHADVRAGRVERERLEALAASVCEIVSYQPGTTTVADTAATAVRRGQGVCQDQAHVFLACCRAAGLPARYVSGYLLAGGGVEVASHAWAEVWQERAASWLGIDVTHACAAGADHCRLAVGRDYLDASPVRGTRFGGGLEALRVNVQVSTQAVQQ